MKRVIVAVLVAAVLVLPACGKKTDESVRAAGITPVDALGLLSLNLAPSIEQKRSLLSVARRFPDAAEKVKDEFDDTRDELIAEVLEDSGLDYKADVKPWLGNEVALVVLPPPGEVVVDGALGRQVVREHVPLAAGTVEVEDGVDHFPHLDLPRPSHPVDRDQRLDDGPLGVGQVGGIGLTHLWILQQRSVLRVS